MNNLPMRNNSLQTTNNQLVRMSEDFLDDSRNLTLEDSEDHEFLELFFQLKIQKRNKKKLSEKTLKAYRNDAQTLFEFLHENGLNLKEIGFPEVQMYNAFINQKYAIRSAIRKLDFFRRILVFGYQTHFYKSDFSVWIEKPTAIRGHYSSDEVENIAIHKTPRLRELEQEDARKIVFFFEKILSEKTRKYRDFLVVRNRLIGYLLYSTGMRASEITSLDFSSFRKVRGGAIYVDVLGKGNKPRTIPIFEQTLRALDDYKEIVIKDIVGHPNELDNLPLLFTPFGSEIKRMSYYTLYKIVKLAVKEAEKNPNISPHWFRHSYVTMLLENDVPLATVKDLVGHSDISTTNIYLEKINEDKKHEQLSKLNLGL